MFDHGLKPGESIDNDRLRDIFKCSPQGGMRKSNATNTLVLISNHIKSIYEDRWVGNILHYTGMGLTGDQDLNYSQNRTLKESSANSVDVFLFEVFNNQAYTFIGPVELTDEPYQEIQPDEAGEDRKVWVFPLQVIGDAIENLIDKNILDQKDDFQRRKAKRLSNSELKLRANHSKTTGYRDVKGKAYSRSPYLSELVKRLAKGICALCQQPAPFKNQNGEPYLETHHIKWLAAGGEDILGNTVALCPNCHRKMHILNSSEDRTRLRKTVLERG